jgi:hypothetical protein
MATRATTKTAPAFTDADFDNWTDDDEEKAVVALIPDIKHIIVEKNFVGRFEDGVIIQLPLNITLADLDEMSEKTENPVEQVKQLLLKLGGEDAVREFATHNFTETLAMTTRFFDVFERVAGAKRPES